MGFSRVPCDAAGLPRRGSPTHPSTVMQQKGRKLFRKLPSFLHLEPLVRKRLRLARTPVYFSRKYTVKQERACQTNGWKCSGACRCLSRCPRTSGNVSLRGAGCARLRAGRPCSVKGNAILLLHGVIGAFVKLLSRIFWRRQKEIVNDATSRKKQETCGQH